jgi:hypothetical protein
VCGGIRDRLKCSTAAGAGKALAGNMQVRERSNRRTGILTCQSQQFEPVGAIKAGWCAWEADQDLTPNSVSRDTRS